ncbi:MAG: ATP-binding cassette domain-containing protein [Rickettsiales bacterium]|jgi:ABC-type branched-subunit amino acid transport system ATPase component|nr:ATP-binding cassette domain-containing protein [Rickettsiales bacterium]
MEIKVSHLSKSFGGLRAVDDLTVTIPHGRTTGLIGPNGSGKTTLMNLLTGTLEPDCGEIIIGDKSFTRMIPTDLRNLKIARTFQDGRLINQMSVSDNLLLAIVETRTVPSLMDNSPLGMGGGAGSRAGVGSRLNTILKKIHLTEKRDANAEELSYGQRKLLELGRAMITDADVYLLDEPFTGLFPAMVEQVAEILTELKSAGKTLVIIEHNIGLIRRLADNVIVMDHGALLASGTPDKVLKNKAVQQAYLGV